MATGASESSWVTPRRVCAARQAVKFALVGGSGVLVNMAVAIAANRSGPAPEEVLVGPLRFYHLYSMIAFCVAMVWNYQLNRAWTFSSVRHWGRGLLDFASISVVVQLVGMVVETWLMKLGPELPESSGLTTWWYWAHLATIVIMFPAGWLANRRWTFRDVRDPLV